MNGEKRERKISIRDETSYGILSLEVDVLTKIALIQGGWMVCPVAPEVVEAGKVVEEWTIKTSRRGLVNLYRIVR